MSVLSSANDSTCGSGCGGRSAALVGGEGAFGTADVIASAASSRLRLAPEILSRHTVNASAFERGYAAERTG